MTPLPWLALDTSGDQASVAVGSAGVILAEEVVRGSRRHAVELVPATERVLAAAQVAPAGIHGILVTDGPGSFTGLRIGATVAKALAHTGQVPVRTASALLVIARSGWKQAKAPRRVLAVSDALRGEYYAALYDITEAEIETVREPHVVRPEALAGWELPSLVVSQLELNWSHLAEVQRAGGESAQPRASVLLELLGIRGATREIPDLETWEPDYGRPAEAQARWEAAHGRRLPDSAGTAR